MSRGDAPLVQVTMDGPGRAVEQWEHEGVALEIAAALDVPADTVTVTDFYPVADGAIVTLTLFAPAVGRTDQDSVDER